MLNFHDTLPPQPGCVSFDPIVEEMRGPRAASQLGKFVASSLLINGGTPEVTDYIVDQLAIHPSYPYEAASEEEYFFLKSAARIISSRAEAEGVSA